jgi:hypothetical protein
VRIGRSVEHVAASRLTRERLRRRDTRGMTWLHRRAAVRRTRDAVLLGVAAALFAASLLLSLYGLLVQA